MREELIFARADDGWRIALTRLRARGTGHGGSAVICCHGLAANHVAFDPDERHSIARHLAEHGHDVFLLDLRGHGRSERPSRRTGRRWGWSFDDYLRRDVPAAIARVRELGARTVHWIGHSMGGLLLYAHLARGNDPAVDSGIAVASSLDYSGARSGFHRLVPLKRIAAGLPLVPIDLVAAASARLVGRVVGPFEAFNVWPSNVEPAVWHRVCSRGFHAVSTPVLLQLSTAMQPRGLLSSDGMECYLEGLARSDVPVLALAGDRDAQCPPAAARATLEALGSPRRRCLVFGTGEGHADHYGHFDLLIGRRARDEVWPHVVRWLEGADD